MPDFSYRAYDRTGQILSGAVSARDEGEAVRALHLQGLLPFEARLTGSGSAAGERRPRRRLRSSDVALILRDLSALLEASIPVDAALRVAAAQAGSVKHRAVLQGLHEAVVRGNPLSDAMAAAGLFSPSQIAVVRAGEVAGTLPECMRNLSLAQERAIELKGRIRGALFYPGVLVAMGLLSLGLIFAVMAPAIAPLFKGQDRPMPPVLAIATAVIGFLGAYGLHLLIGIGAAAVLLARSSRTEAFRARRDRLVLRAPLAGPIAREAETARFARTFGILLGSGAPLLQSMSITAEAMGNRDFRRGLTQAIEALSRGASLADALAAPDMLPEASRSLIAVGEETNRLPELLMRVAEANEKDLDRRIERLMTVLTPMLTVGIGILVGGIILAVMNAILSTNELAF